MIYPNFLRAFQAAPKVTKNHFFYVKNYDFADYQLYVVIGTPNAIH